MYFLHKIDNFNTPNYTINMVKMHTLAGLAATAAVYACLILILAVVKAMWDYKIVAIKN